MRVIFKLLPPLLRHIACGRSLYRIMCMLVALTLGAQLGCESHDKRRDKGSKPDATTSNKRRGEERAEKSELKPTPVEVSVVRRGPISLKLRAVSVIEPRERASIRSLVSGVIVKLTVEEGDRVRAGQLLAQISRPGANSLLRQAASSYRKALRDLKHIKSLVKQGLAPREELNQAQFQRDQRALELSRLRSEAKHERITSPIAGVIVRRSVYQGETVSPGQEVAEVMDLSEVYAPLHLPDRWAHRVTLNLPATLLDREGEPLIHNAYVSRVSPVIDAETGTFKAWVSPPKLAKTSRRRRTSKRKIKNKTKGKLKGNTVNEALKLNPRASLLKPGLFVTAELTLAKRTDVLLLTREAVMYRDGTPMVALVREGRVHITKLKLGFTDQNHVEITSPLREGDRVVSFGQRGLEEGARVKVIEPRTE